MRGKKAILWDNDGILVDTETLYFETTRDALLEVDIILSEEVFSEVNLRQSKGAWFLAEDAGVPDSRIDELRALRNARYKDLVGRGNLEIPGAETVLRSLQDKLTMGIVTSCSKEHFYDIHNSTNILSLVEFILVREDYRVSKPDPEPYLLALEKAGVAPSEALVVEDSERGLRAAKSAGIECWVIPCGLSKNGDFKEADRVLNDISEIPELILGR